MLLESVVTYSGRKMHTGKLGKSLQSITAMVINKTSIQLLNTAASTHFNMLITERCNSVSTRLLPAAQSASIEVTQRTILRFISPQGPHIALMAVKFDIEEWT